MANPQTIANINGSARIHLEAVKQVDNASKLVQAAVQRVSVQQQKLVESILQVVQTAIHDATENQLRLDSKLADVILMRIASLLDGFKTDLANPVNINVQAAKKEILEKLEDVSEGFFSKFIKQYLAQQIVNLIQDPATKDDIEDLKLYLDEVFQNSRGERNQEITVDGEHREIAEEAAEAVVDRQQVLEDRRQKRYEATIDNVSSGVTKLLNSIRDLFTNKVVPTVTKDVQTSAKWQRYANTGFEKVNQGIQNTAQYLKKNVSPQFGILKGVMLTAVLAPLLSIGKDILGSVGKYALIATGIMFLYNFFKQEKGLFDYLTSDALGDLAEGWKGIFGFLGDVGSTLWDAFGGLLDPIFKKIGEWIKPKITEWVNEFISKLDIGKIGLGSFGNLVNIAQKVAETLQPIADIMEKEHKSFFEAAIEWWDSEPNKDVREKVEKLTSLLDVLKPLAEEFKVFEQNIRENETFNKEEVTKSYGDIFSEFILSKFGLKKDTLSQAVQNIADLDVQKINDKLGSLEIPDLSGVTTALKSVQPIIDKINKVSEKKKDGELTLGDIMKEIWDDFTRENELTEIIDVFKGLAKEIAPYMKKDGGGFSAYLSSIVNSVIAGTGLAGIKNRMDDLSTGYTEAKEQADKTNGKKNVWQQWFENSGLKAALLIEIPNVIDAAFKEFLKNNPGMNALVGDNGLVIKLNNMLDQYGLGKPKANEQKDNEKKEPNGLFGRARSAVSNAVKGVDPATMIINLITQILNKLEETKQSIDSVKSAIDRAMAVIEDMRQKLADYKVFGTRPFKELGAGENGPRYDKPQNQVEKRGKEVSQPPPPSPVTEANAAAAVDGTLGSTVRQQDVDEEERAKANAEKANEVSREASAGQILAKKLVNKLDSLLGGQERAEQKLDKIKEEVKKPNTNETIVVTPPATQSNDAARENSNSYEQYYRNYEGV